MEARTVCMGCVEMDLVVQTVTDALDVSFTTFTCHVEDNCLSIQDYWLTSLDEMLEFFVVAF